MRHVDSASRWLFSLGAHCNDRLVFRDFPPLNRLLRKLQQVFTFKYIWYVNTSSGANNAGGNAEVGSSLQGLGCSVKIMRVDNLEAVVKKLNAPLGCGTIFYFDILLRDESSEENKVASPSTKGKKGSTISPEISVPMTADRRKNVDALVRLLHLFLQHHFEKELKNSNSYVNNLQVYITKNELDDADVIRVQLSYKKLVNIDKFIEYLIIPYKLNELVNIFMLDFRSNVDLQDLCTHNKLQSLNEVLSCTVSYGYFRKCMMCSNVCALSGICDGEFEEEHHIRIG